VTEDGVPLGGAITAEEANEPEPSLVWIASGGRNEDMDEGEEGVA